MKVDLAKGGCDYSLFYVIEYASVKSILKLGMGHIPDLCACEAEAE